MQYKKSLLTVIFSYIFISRKCADFLFFHKIRYYQETLFQPKLSRCLNVQNCYVLTASFDALFSSLFVCAKKTVIDCFPAQIFLGILDPAHLLTIGKKRFHCQSWSKDIQSVQSFKIVRNSAPGFLLGWEQNPLELAHCFSAYYKLLGGISVWLEV